VLHFLRQRQGLLEVGEIVCQGVMLEPHLVVAELAAGQSRSLDGKLTFFDPLFRRAPVIVEGDASFGRTGQVGSNEADCRVKLVLMPFDLGDLAAFRVPRSGRVTKAWAIAASMIGQTVDRAAEQMRDALLENLVGGQAHVKRV